MSHHKHHEHSQDPDQQPQAQQPAEQSQAEAAAQQPQPQVSFNEELAQLQKENQDLLGRLQRLSADFANYQKRIQRDLAQSQDFANESLMKALLGVLDDMDRGIQAGLANHNSDDPLIKGMQLVHDKALATLSSFGLSAIEAAGQPFTPELHSAVAQEASTQVPPQTVLHELAKGYRLKGRTIRPAMVVVSKAPEEENK